MNHDYELLRRYYLAHLRKGAIAEQSRMVMTPAALIAADRDAVEHLIDESRQVSVEPTRAAWTPIVAKAVIWIAFWIVGCLSFLLWLFIDTGADSQSFWLNLSLITLGPLAQGKNLASVMPVFVLFPVFLVGLPLVGLIFFYSQTINANKGD